jgi:dihydrodipicolinate synthase/N-acetylneuraminate lyase
MLSAKDFHGLWAIIPTPAKPGADRADAVDTVDLDETARVVDKLIRDGSDALIVLGTTGECATLTRDEYEAFVDTVLATVNKRIPCFVGTTALGTHEVVYRTRFAQDRGADGILLGLPMWQPLTVVQAVEYYRSVGELFPKLAIQVYGNPRAFRFAFPPEFWGAVVKAVPTITSAKYSRPKALLESQAASNGKVHFLPNDGGVMQFVDLAPETTTACWSTAASMGPEPALAQIRAIQSGDIERARAIAKDLKWTREPIAPIVADADLFASYNIQLEKTRIGLAGYCKAGPLRPPYNVYPEEYHALFAENATRWRELCARYSKVAAP